MISFPLHTSLTLALLKSTITSHFLWTFLCLISLTNLIQSGKGPLILVHFSSMCILVFLFHKLSLDTMIYICKADSPMWWESYLVQSGVVLVPSQLGCWTVPRRTWLLTSAFPLLLCPAVFSVAFYLLFVLIWEACSNPKVLDLLS